MTPRDSIDAHLGAAHGRFFGDGFKRIGHRMEDVAIDGRTITARAGLVYPEDWSRKASATLRPHLSSVDALVLAAQLAEAHLTHARGLSPVDRRRLWLRSFDMRGGGVPQEDLAAIDVGAKLVSDTPARVATYACHIGTLKVTCELNHDAAPRYAEAGTYASIDDVLGPAADRYYGDGYRYRTQGIDGVRVARDGRSIAAAVELVTPRECRSGLGAAYQPAASMLDALVCLAQLAQVLAYRLDGIERARSRTLWMRRLHQVSHVLRPADRPMPATLALERSRLLPLGTGTWRALDVVGEIGGIHVRSSIAHELPEEARLAA